MVYLIGKVRPTLGEKGWSRPASEGKTSLKARGEIVQKSVEKSEGLGIRLRRCPHFASRRSNLEETQGNT